MKYTNKLNLPEVFNKVMKNKDYDPHRYSVTELLKPTQEIVLTRLHYDDIEVDISEYITTLFGSAVHKVFEENSNPEESEVKLEVNLGEDTIVGIIDSLKDEEIEDYKTSSVSKVLKQDFKDHELQIKIYAWIRFKKYNIITRKGTLYYLLKDWSKVKAINSKNYPLSPIYIHQFNISDSDYDYVESYIKNKLKEIHDYKNIKCSNEDRWYTGTEYAVYKNVSDKKASYVTNDEIDAHNYISNKCGGAGEIKVRKGKFLKCELYCQCSKFCKQYKEEN